MRPAVGLADLAHLLRTFSVEDRVEAARLLGFRRVADPSAASVEQGTPLGGERKLAAITSPPLLEQGLTRDDRASDTPPAIPPSPPPLLHDDDDDGEAGGSTVLEQGRRLGRWWRRWLRSRVSRGPSVREAPVNRARFLRVEMAMEHEAATMISPPPPEQGLTRDDLKSDVISAAPLPSPLAEWSTLWSRLRAALQTSRPSRNPDVAALLRTWARGECLQRIPRLKRPSWTTSATLWIDRSNRLTPFWDDQEIVYRQLVRICGVAAIVRRVLDSHRQASLAAWYGDLIGSRAPDSDRPVLVLGDLGFYGTESDRARWLRTARRLRRNGVPVAALVPCPPDRWDHELARAWNATPWERPSALGDSGTPEARAEALLRLVAPTALAQPGLLRALRQLLPATAADASTEVDVWRHVDVQAADVNGLVLKSEASARWRKRFAADAPAAVQAEVSRLIDQWHGGWRAELLHAETLAWIAHGVPGAPGRPDEARAFIKKVAATLCAEGVAEEVVAVVKHYGRHLLSAFPDQGYSEFPELKKVWSVSFADVAAARLPSTIGPRELFVRTPQAPRRWIAHQRGEVLVMVPATTSASAPAEDDEPGSPVATIAAATPEVWVRRRNYRGATRTWLTPYVEIPLRPGERITLLTDCSEVALGIWEHAPWAVAAGRDRYGLWAAFEVNGVQQRLRWIPPGRFRMGSPPTEAGRHQDEGPEHWVTITNGYWLGETPVTQALWVAVMGKNPSYFRGKRHVDLERPVEQVSWDDCQVFLGRLDTQIAGLGFMLPTEAEWERACRAETHGATWVGNLSGEMKAPELDAIAWYQGNSGAETHPVGHKAPNPYGLHDMLGNVYEWCADAAEDLAKPHPYTDEAVTDPVASMPDTNATADAYRVDRGGSWRCSAGSLRAARRLTDARGRRLNYLGLRLVGVEASAPR